MVQLFRLVRLVLASEPARRKEVNVGGTKSADEENHDEDLVADYARERASERSTLRDRSTLSAIVRGQGRCEGRVRDRTRSIKAQDGRDPFGS